MGLILRANNLLSRAIRFNTAAGRSGSSILNGTGGDGILTVAARKLRNLTRLSGSQGEGGILDFIFNAGSALVGFIGRLVGVVGFSATAIWGWLVNRIEAVKAFNWNATDTELIQSLQSQNVAIAAQWGSVAGQGFGWLAGIGIGYGIAYLCPVIGGAALGKAVAGAVSEEAIQELIPALRSAIVATAGAMANNLLINGYMNARRLFKSLPLDVLSTLVGSDTARWIKDKWGGEGEPDLSFNGQMDDAIENVPNPLLRAFLENFFEESWDSFTEAGFIVASEIDAAFQQSRAANQKALGSERTVEVLPDSRNEDEKLSFQSVPQRLLQPAIQQAVNAHRLIYNRDVGAIVGQPYEEAIRARYQLRKLTIEFNERERPPFRLPDGKMSKRAFYSVPDAKRGLTWSEIKTAANRYNWGKFRATAQLNNQRQMVVYGATAVEAEQKLRELAVLTTAEILRLSITEEEFVPERMRKRTTMMYPVSFTLLSRLASVDEQGRVTIDNRVWDEKIIRVPLWMDSAPPNLEPLG